MSPTAAYWGPAISSSATACSALRVVDSPAGRFMVSCSFVGRCLGLTAGRGTGGLIRSRPIPRDGRLWGGSRRPRTPGELVSKGCASARSGFVSCFLARDEVSPGIAPDVGGQPVGGWFGADHDEHRACRFLDESQHPTTPQVVHQRRWTQVSPERTQGTHSWVSAVSTRIMSRWPHRVTAGFAAALHRELEVLHQSHYLLPGCGPDGRNWRGRVWQSRCGRRNQSSSASWSMQSRAGPSAANSSFMAASRSSAALTRMPVAPHCRANSAQSGLRSEVCHTG